MLRRYLPLLLLLVAPACAEPVSDPLPPVTVEPEAETEAPRSATSIRFSLDEDRRPTAWGDVPFPSDLYRDDEGIRLDGFPSPIADQPLFDTFEELLDRRGFCTTCSITFRVDGDLDVSSLDGAVHLLNVDEQSPGFGESIPLEIQYDRAEALLAARPAAGSKMEAATRYSAFVTSDARGTDGIALAPPEALREMLDDEPAVTLEELGFAPEELAGYTAFTTDDPHAQLEVVRDVVVATDAPTATLDRVWTGEEIDELLGKPLDETAGFGRPSELDGVAMRHATTRIVVSGTFDAARLLSGEEHDVGVVARDADGEPIVVGRHDVPFVLIVPADADLGELPVLVVHHGFSASRKLGFALADTAGRAGFAVLAIDAYQHGARAQSAGDHRNEMRGGIDGADGFAETNKLDVTSRVFGFAGVPHELRLSPQYALSAFTQMVADVVSTIRFVREGSIAALRDAEPALAALRFDPERIAYMGNSMGSVVGLGVVAVEPELRGAVLTVMPGSIIETLADSGEFRPLSERLFLPLLGVEREFDEVEVSMLFDPTVDLFRWALEPVDPLALGEAASRSDARILVQLAGHDEIAAPTASRSVVDSAGIDTTTYDGASHNMIHARTDESRFEAPLIQPLVSRPEKVIVENPTDAVHDEIERFLFHLMESDDP